MPDRADEIASRAARTWLLDEYLLRSDKFSSLRVGNILNGNKPYEYSQKNYPLVKFQPHCHQRAEGLAPDGLPSGANATVALLTQCGYEIELLDAGCCGMAGTFGYEAEHYDLSMQVGELKLFPLLRELDDKNVEACITGTGAACRLQISQGVNMDVKHPIELVRKAVLAGVSQNV